MIDNTHTVCILPSPLLTTLGRRLTPSFSLLTGRDVSLELPTTGTIVHTVHSQGCGRGVMGLCRPTTGYPCPPVPPVLVPRCPRQQMPQPLPQTTAMSPTNVSGHNWLESSVPRPRPDDLLPGGRTSQPLQPIRPTMPPPPPLPPPTPHHRVAVRPGQGLQHPRVQLPSEPPARPREASHPTRSSPSRRQEAHVQAAVLPDPLHGRLPALHSRPDLVGRYDGWPPRPP